MNFYIAPADKRWRRIEFQISSDAEPYAIVNDIDGAYVKYGSVLSVEKAREIYRLYLQAGYVRTEAPEPCTASPTGGAYEAPRAESEDDEDTFVTRPYSTVEEYN